MAGVVDALTEWLENAWENSSGIEGFQQLVRATLRPDDSSTVAAVLEFGNEDEAYLAQLALRILGAEADSWEDQDGTLRYRLLLPSEQGELTITPLTQPGSDPELARLHVRNRLGERPIEALAASLANAGVDRIEPWDDLVS
jgi:hypothetical protein